MTKINVLLTFDYELPLGGVTGTFDESLFDPTNALLNCADKLEVPLNFFADVLSYDRFKELKRPDYYLKFASQMKSACEKGHDVQLHLHPHWKETKVINDTFETSNKYGLDSFANEDYPNSIEDIIEKGISSIKEILEDEDYNCLAYRAGGYVLEPEAGKILSALRRKGIKIDSSICKGSFYKSDLSKVDYTNVPKKANWFLDLNGDFSKEGSSNGIFEIPIAGKAKSIFEVPTALKMKKCAHRAPKSGGRMIHSSPVHMNFEEKIKKLSSSRMLTFDNYTYSTSFNQKILSSYVNQFKKEDEIFLSVIGHPKTMGKYALELMTKFVEDSKKKYGDQIRFITFTEAANKLGL